jgi:hypothetical protein
MNDTDKGMMASFRRAEVGHADVHASADPQPRRAAAGRTCITTARTGGYGFRAPLAMLAAPE